jgi:hypothetical protein
MKKATSETVPGACHIAPLLLAADHIAERLQTFWAG